MCAVKIQVFGTILVSVLLLLYVYYVALRDTMTRQNPLHREYILTNKTVHYKDEDLARRIKDKNKVAYSSSADTDVKKKLILVYTSWYGDPNWTRFIGFNIANYSKTCGCKYKNCLVTKDKSLFTKSDIVIFHGRDITSKFDWDKLNAQRPQHQMWVYLIFENPYNTGSPMRYRNYFNLTFSYRSNSDIFRQRGAYRVLNETERKLIVNKNYVQGKTKQMAWFVSHCGQLRDKVASKLLSYGVNIHFGGHCFKSKTRIQCRDRNCIEERRKYKFYFSAENNFCKDYITEKYWDNPFAVDQVPVVLGGADYSKFAIPGSYIDAMSFNSIQDLATYIKALDKNDTAYNEYFLWKRRYKKTVAETGNGCLEGICTLCTILNEDKTKHDTLDLMEFVNAQAECQVKENQAREWVQR